MKLFTLDNEQLAQALNKGSVALIEALVRDKVLTQEQADKILTNYALLVYQPSFFTIKIREFWFDKETKDSSDLRISAVKLV